MTTTTSIIWKGKGLHTGKGYEHARGCSWRLWSDGRIEKTNKARKYRLVGAHMTPPDALMSAARERGIKLVCRVPDDGSWIWVGDGWLPNE